MIELKHVNKRFNNDYVLKDIKITFPRYGIVVIYGPSGCGKSTLLHIISSLCDFEGDVTFDGKKYKAMKEDEKDKLRNTKMGFVFQDYKLFEFETVKNNLLLAIDMKCSDKKEQKERRIDDLLKVIGLENKKNTSINKLSGGEKQRVAIARAISNSPSVVLADEPTGNLDSKNSKLVMNLMERISKSSLVIMVSHDEELTKKYADQIIYMSDGKIKKVEYNNHNNHFDLLPLVHLTANENKPKLPVGFCVRHTFSNIKRRKWRTMFVLLSTSLGLICVGLGAVLSNIISTNLYKSYSSIIDANKVIVTPKDDEENKHIQVNALSHDETEQLKNDYFNSINKMGVYYANNFEQMFTSYSFSIDTGERIKPLPDYTISLVNEFVDLKDNKNVVYPYQLTAIENDEIIMGLTYPTLNEICFQLTIKRTVESFSNYLKEHILYINVDISNSNWGYDVSFPLKVKGFTMCKNNSFVHSNPLWNEFFFEEKCCLSTTDIINSNSKNPWDLKKVFFLEFKKDRDQFLTDIKFSKQYQNVVAEVLTEDYYPNLNNGLDCEECDRVALFSLEKPQGIGGYYNKYIKLASRDIDMLTYGCKNGYAIYPDSLMMGFSKSTYLSNNLNYIDDAIDLTAYLKYEESLNVTVPDNVIEGHFAKSNLDGLTFSPRYNLVEGRKPLNNSEIIISKGIQTRLKIESPINQSIYISFPLMEELLPNGYLSRNYKTAELQIVGVSDSQKYQISHEEEWSIMFFQTNLGVSNFDLIIDSVAIDIADGKEENVIASLGRAFPNFTAVSPISGVKESIQKVCGYIEKILLMLSISSVVISSLLLSICNYLHFVEIKKDIGLIRCIGTTKDESSKFIFVHSFIFAFISSLMSSIQLLMVCFLLSKSLSEIFEISATFIFNPLALLYMFGLSFIICLLSSLVIKRKVDKLNPLECLRS